MMLRRPVCRVSRRAGWSSSACLAPSSTALTIRRTLRSSTTRLNSSESSSGNGDGSPADSAPAKPKFGSRWGPTTTAQKPAGLSAAEQAMRDAMVAKAPPPPPAASNKWAQPTPQAVAPNSRGLSAAEQAMRRNLVAENQKPPPSTQRRWDQPNQERRHNHRRFGDQRENQGSVNMKFSKDILLKPKRKPSQEQNPFHEPNPFREPNPFQEANPFQQRDSYRPRKPQSDRSNYRERNPFQQHNSPRESNFPTQDRPRNENLNRPFTNPLERSDAKPVDKGQTNPSEDWNCPSCMAHVFSYKIRCPFCKTYRPEQPRSNYRMTRDYGDVSAPSKSQHPSNANPKFQELGRSVLSDMDQEVKNDAEKSKDTDHAPEATEADESQPKKDPWSWDMSALAQLEMLEAQELQQQQPVKQMKRRDGRKGRVAQPEASDFDSEARERLRQDRRRQQKEKDARKALKKAAPAPLYLPEFISVSNLADVVGVKPAQFVARMEEMGFEEITYRDVLDAETAGLVAAEYNFEAIFDTGADDLEAAPQPEDTSDLPSRPPVVTIMGHVDHGKTTILDWLRNSSVAASEHGGITQHIGAFSVNMPGGKAITFLDTPGHSAFLEMRRRGADVTDIVVLVVAADDSVKPQTIEAIKHANSAKVPVIVAISKIDKEGKNPDKVKSDLSSHGVHVEDFGGDVQAIGVSGKTGEGMLELEEAIMVLSEMLDHRADTACNVEGWVIEASTKSYGRVASALIRRGTLRPGDIIVAGTAWARVRTLRNEAGVAIDEATPGMPVEIDGWREQPGAGTEILQAPTEQKAKDVVDYRSDRSDTQKMGVDMAAINDARREIAEKRRRESEDEEATRQRLEPTGPKPVNFILKADVDGSAEAVLNSVTAVGNNEVFAHVIRSGVGPVSEFDIEHAATAKGKIISFNQPIDPAMMRTAETEGVQILDHNVIYKLTDEVKSILSDQLPPTIITRVTGEAEIREVFDITVKGREKMSIAGSRVRNGMINKSRKVKVIRGEETVYDGAITSLKNVKKDVTEMRKDTECGIGFEDWAEFQVGDRVQCYDEIFEKRYL